MKYTSRDAQSNIQNLIEDIESMTHIWQPGSESDPGMVLLKALAANVDLLSFNLDTQVDEMYMQSATQIKSIRRLGVANGYQPTWYRAARTTVCISNISDADICLDFSLPGTPDNVCYASRNALDSLTSIPYFIIPKTGLFDSDRPILHPKGSTDLLGPTDCIYREAAQGILKSVIVNPVMLNTNGSYVSSLTYRLPAQNIDSELIWVEEVTGNLVKDETVNWEFDGNNGFIDSSIDKPKYQIAVDDYNNLIILFNASINNTIQAGNRIRIYYIETYGVVGEIAPNVLSLSSIKEPDVLSLTITHPGNTRDIADGSALTGKAPMTAHEAALDAQNWINTNDSIITLKNFTSWIRRQPGISTGVAIDCQKALELNWAIYYDADMVEELKPLKYIMPGDYIKGNDFPENIDSNGRVWDPLVGSDLPFPHTFLVYKLVYFVIYNNFQESYSDGVETIQCAEWGQEEPNETRPYRRYRIAKEIRDKLQRKYLELYNLTCSIDFGYVRVFEWCVNGVVYTKKPVSKTDAESLINTILETLRIRFNAKNMEIGVLPRLVDVVDCVETCDDRIQYFDAGLLNLPMIEWCPVRDYTHRTPNSSVVCNPDYFNYISFARFIDGDPLVDVEHRYSKISIAKECILPEVRG